MYLQKQTVDKLNIFKQIIKYGCNIDMFINQYLNTLLTKYLDCDNLDMDVFDLFLDNAHNITINNGYAEYLIYKVIDSDMDVNMTILYITKLLHYDVRLFSIAKECNNDVTYNIVFKNLVDDFDNRKIDRDELAMVIFTVIENPESLRAKLLALKFKIQNNIPYTIDPMIVSYYNLDTLNTGYIERILADMDNIW